MQIAGSRCVACDQNVGIIRDGKACAQCRVVYHKACLEDSRCPRCGQALLSGDEAHSVPSHSERVRRERPTSVTVIGRLTYLGVPASVLWVLVGVVQIAGDFVDGVATILSGLLVGLLSAALGSGLLNGREWARRFYLWVTPLVLAVQIVVGENGTIQSGFSWWRFGLGLGAYCAFAFALTRPKTIAFFKRATSADATAA